MNDTTDKTATERLAELDGETMTLPGSIVARAFTVAAMNAWTPKTDDPFTAIRGDVKVDARIVGEAYIVAVSAGWHPEKDDPLAQRLIDLGLLKEG